MLILDKSPVGRRAKYVVLADSADLTPSGDYTFEFFDVIFDSVAAQGTLYSHYNASAPFSNQRSLLLDYLPGTGLRFGMSADGTSGGTTTISYSWTPTTGVPYQLCFERSGSLCRIYRDGTMVASGTKAGALHNTTDDAYIGIGRSGNSLVNPFTGSCKAFRPTMAARYNTNGSYTVPSRPLPTS